MEKMEKMRADVRSRNYNKKERGVNVHDLKKGGSK